MKLVPKRIFQLGRVVTGKTPSTKRDEFFGGDYLFVTPSDIEYDHYYCRTTERSVTEETKAALPNQFVPADAVMFTCIGATIGKCAIAPAECLTNQQINSVVANENTDSKFLYYLLCHNVDVVKGLGGGAATPIVSKSKFEEVEFLVPSSLRDQRAASAILSAYDDLIENNRRRMALLEDAARQLYREWFVRLRFPGHEHIRIVDGVPEGWERRPLSAVCVQPDGIQTGPFGSQLHQSDYSDEGVPVVMPKDLIDYRIAAESPARIPEDLANKLGRHRMTMGDTVYGRRGDIGRRAFIGKRQVGWLCGTGCLRIRPDSTAIKPRFLFDSLGSPNTAGVIANRAHGVTMPNLNATVLRSVPVLVAGRRLQEYYAEQVAPLTEMIELLDDQNQRLRAARDLLLPRLMSGEIPV